MNYYLIFYSFVCCFAGHDFVASWNPDEASEFPYGDLISIPDQVEYWPDGLVYYYFNLSSISAKKLVWSAMEEFHNYTCIRFEENESFLESVVIELQDHDSCYSDLGKRVGGSRIVLGPACLTKGAIIHQLMHALGFHHENNRFDRDEYIDVSIANVASLKAFDKLKANYIDRVEPYDYDSVTHFSAIAYSKHEDKPTLSVRRKSTDFEIGQRQYLSDDDINKINIRYECNGMIISLPTSTTALAPTTTVESGLEIECKYGEDITAVHKHECWKYFVCSHGNLYNFSCPTKHLCYDPINKMCVWPKNFFFSLNDN